MHEVVAAVFATTALLALVSLLLPFAKRFSIPYAVLLALVGVALGVPIAALGDIAAGDDVGNMFRLLGSLRLSGEAFLYIFLPPLLFETAINVDVRRMIEEMAPVLLMAVVAVVVSTFAVGFALAPFADVGLIACLMLGAILATTDPVAVVAIFRDIGAPRRLSTLVEGESLFNDAAAIALFTLLAAMLTGSGDGSVLGGLTEFVRDFAGGVAFGVAAGWAVCLLLPLLRGQRLAEVTLTVAAAYLAFVVGDAIEVSGVVATVCAGLVLNHQGRQRLSPSHWGTLTETWEQLGFWASSLIFLLAAMLIPRLLADIRMQDLLLLGIVIVSAFAARAVTLYGLLPMLSAAGLADRVLNSHKLVILWGGLRGAVSLALALAVTEDPSIPPEVRRFVAILATGFVLFTLLVNAPTLRYVMRLLQLDRLSPEELALRNRALVLARAEVADGITAICRDYGLRLDADGMAANAIPVASVALPPEGAIYSGLAILTEHEQELCLQRFESHTVSRRVLADLVAHVGRLRDGGKTGGLDGYRSVAAENLGFGGSFRVARHIQRWLGVSGPLALALARRLELLSTMRIVLRRLSAFEETKVRHLLGEEAHRVLAEALAERLAAVERAIAAIELQYPLYAADLRRQIVALSALRLEEESIARLHEESILSREVFATLTNELGHRRQALRRRQRLDLGLRRADLVERVALLADLPATQRAEIERLMQPRFAVPGERIVRKGDRGDGMYFISSGAVEVALDRPVRLGNGDFFGEMALIDDSTRNAHVDALGFCQLLFLARRDFERLMAREPELRARIYERAAARRNPA